MPTHPTTKRRFIPLTAADRDYDPTRAAMLDRLADAELQHGHSAAAEWLAHRAAELREAAR